VVSSQTSMLVLETEDDYARYGIDRKALADVLVVGPAGLERQHRSSPVQLAVPEVAQQPDVTKQKGKELALAGADPGTTTSANDGDGQAPADKAPVDAKVPAAPMAEPRPSPTRVAEPPPPPAPSVAAPPREMPKAEEKMDDDDARAGEASRDQEAADDAEDDAPRAHRGRRAPSSDDDAPREHRRAPSPDDEALEEGEAWPPPGSPPALKGELADIEHRIQRRDLTGALADARDWHAREPGNVLALIGLGDALEARGSKVTAARVYGSIIDLFPGRADMRRFAGERLARINGGANLIIDTYRRAVADRPDHLTGHRLLAYALLRSGKPAEAFDAILAGIDQRYPDGRFAGGERVLSEDAGMLGAALIRAQPGQRSHVMAELGRRGLALVTQPSTRFILYWETDGNDVDFHIQDGRGGHAYYASPHLRSGGDLYADITTGYGPECFAIQGTPKAGPYRLSINYYSQGPMGYGMGLLEVQRYDGNGKLSFEDRPYVIMNDQAYVDLGKI
jgi:hypothetical protein